MLDVLQHITSCASSMRPVQYIMDCICAYISAKVLICVLYVSGKGAVYDG